MRGILVWANKKQEIPLCMCDVQKGAKRTLDPTNKGTRSRSIVIYMGRLMCLPLFKSLLLFRSNKLN